MGERSLEESLRKALLEIIELELILKFGASAVGVIFRVREIKDVKRLRALKDSIPRFRTLEEVEKTVRGLSS